MTTTARTPRPRKAPTGKVVDLYPSAPAPHDDQLERDVLASLMSGTKGPELADTFATLGGSWSTFYRYPSTARVILSLLSSGRGAAPTLVALEAKALGVEHEVPDAAELLGWGLELPSIGGDDHLRALVQLSEDRKLQRAATDLSHAIGTGDRQVQQAARATLASVLLGRSVDPSDPSGVIEVPGSPGTFYRPGLDGCVGHTTKGGDRAVDLDWCPLVTANVVELDDDGSTVRTFVRIVAGGKEATVEWAEVRDGKVWDRFSVPGIGTKALRDRLSNVVAHLRGQLPLTQAFTRSGWHRSTPDDEGNVLEVYVTPDGRDLLGGSAVELLEMATATAAAAVPPEHYATPEEQRTAVLRVLELSTASRWPLLSYGTAARSLFASLHAPSTSVVPVGEAHTGKTSGANVGRQLMFTSPGWPPVATASLANDTAHAIRHLLDREGDVPTLVDDSPLGPDSSEKDHTLQRETLESLIRPTANGGNFRNAGRRDGGLRQGTKARSMPIYSIEYLSPTVGASLRRRAVVVEIAHGDVDVDWLEEHGSELDVPSRTIGEALVRYVRDLGTWEDRSEWLKVADGRWRRALLAQVSDRSDLRSVEWLPVAAAPVLTGLELVELVTGLDPGTLTDPALSALAVHLVQQAAKLDDRLSTSRGLSEGLGEVLRAALLERRAYVSDPKGHPRPMYPGVTPQGQGLSERGSGIVDGEQVSTFYGSGVTLYATDEGLAVMGAELLSLIQKAKDPRFSGVSRSRLADVLGEAGALVESRNKGQRWAHRKRLGAAGRPLWYPIIRPELVWDLVDHDDDPRNDGNRIGGTPSDDGTDGTDGTSLVRGGVAVPSGAIVERSDGTSLVRGGVAAPSGAVVEQSDGTKTGGVTRDVLLVPSVPSPGTPTPTRNTEHGTDDGLPLSEWTSLVLSLVAGEPLSPAASVRLSGEQWDQVSTILDQLDGTTVEGTSSRTSTTAPEPTSSTPAPDSSGAVLEDDGAAVEGTDPTPVPGEVLSWRSWTKGHRSTAFLDPYTGEGVTDAGATFRVGGKRRRKAGATVREVLEGLPVDVRRVYLTGPRPGGGGPDQARSWVMGEIPDGWAHGRHYLSDPELPKGEYHHGTGPGARAVEVHRVRSWGMSDDVDPSAAREVMAEVDRALREGFRGPGLAKLDGKGSYLSTPATTGRELARSSLPFDRKSKRSHTFPVLSQELSDLVRSTTTQRREELTWTPGVDLPELFYLDARFAYSALVKDLPTGPATLVDGGSFTDPYAPARYHVRVTVPDGWGHVGLLGTKVDGGGWRWPSTPGETFDTWAEAVELDLLTREGWSFDVRQVLHYAGKGKPLDAWAGALVRSRDLVTVHETAGEVSPVVADLARSGLRAVMLQAIGAFHGNSHPVTVVSDDPSTAPADAMRHQLDDGSWTWEVHGQSPQPELAHPEWTSVIWARARVRLLRAPHAADRRGAGVLALDRADVVGMHTDAIYSTRNPGWPDDGEPGRYRLKAHVPGPLPGPSTMGDLLSIRELTDDGGVA